jgi:DMSO/TMAO reductase YedYZ molybdopterin-dependent catalytic subunit
MAAPARAQTTTPTAAPEATLVVAGDVTQPLTIKPVELKAMPRTTVTVTSHCCAIRGSPIPGTPARRRIERAGDGLKTVPYRNLFGVRM